MIDFLNYKLDNHLSGSKVFQDKYLRRSLNVFFCFVSTCGLVEWLILLRYDFFVLFSSFLRFLRVFLSRISFAYFYWYICLFPFNDLHLICMMHSKVFPIELHVLVLYFTRDLYISKITQPRKPLLSNSSSLLT